MARWNRLPTRGTVEDRRGGGRMAATGVGGLGIIIALLVMFLGGGEGIDDVLGQLQVAPAPADSGAQPEEFRGEDDYEVLASTVLGSTNDTWRAIFSANGLAYSEPTLVLFRDLTASACGGGTSGESSAASTTVVPCTCSSQRGELPISAHNCARLAATACGSSPTCKPRLKPA